MNEAEGRLTSRDVLEALGDVGRAAEGIRTDMDKRFLLNKITIGLTALLAVVAIVVGGFGLKATVDANSEREQRSLATCQQYNAQERRQGAAERAEWRNFIEVAVAQSTNPEARRFAALFVDGQNALIDKAHPPRDCSPAGIEKFLSHPTTTEKP